MKLDYRMKNFETRFERTRKTMKVLFVINVIVVIAIIISVIFLGWNIYHNPESWGEFFGKIVKGFKSVN